MNRLVCDNIKLSFISTNLIFKCAFSRFSKMGFLGNYVESQWALATFTVPPECACVCAFGSHNSVIGEKNFSKIVKRDISH